MSIAQRKGVTLRQAQTSDLDEIDAITVAVYADIHSSYVAAIGEECYESVRHQPELSWDERKKKQNRDLFQEHPDWVWVLDRQEEIIGFVSFRIIPDKKMGVLLNNGVLPQAAGQGLGKFMYRQVLQYFREHGVRFAFVDTGLDAPHDAARRAYEAVGFNRQYRFVEYWQDLEAENPGSKPDLSIQ